MALMQNDEETLSYAVKLPTNTGEGRKHIQVVRVPINCKKYSSCESNV